MYTGCRAHARTFFVDFSEFCSKAGWPGSLRCRVGLESWSGRQYMSGSGSTCSLPAWSIIAMSTTIRVLAIHAHPDDVEFQCGGHLGLAPRSRKRGDDRDDDPWRLRQRRARTGATIAEIRAGERVHRRRFSEPTISAWSFVIWPSSMMTTRAGGLSKLCVGPGPI